jgi:hypothetical protein
MDVPVKVFFVDNNQGGVEDQWKLSGLAEKGFSMVPFSSFSSLDLTMSKIFDNQPDIIVVAHNLGSCIADGVDVINCINDRMPHTYIIGNWHERSVFNAVVRKIDAHADRDPMSLFQACMRSSCFTCVPRR